MSRTHSISTRRRFGMSRVCRIWGAPRATVYRHRGPAAGGGASNAPRPPRRRGPRGACSDAELLLHIQAVIAASPLFRRGLSKGLSAAAGAMRAHGSAPGAACHEGK